MVGTLQFEKIEDVQKAAAAIQWLDPSCDRNTWVRVGMACHQLGDEGWALWSHWSQGSPKWNEASAIATWRTFHNGTGGIGLGSLIKMAQEAGWDGRTIDAPLPKVVKAPAKAIKKSEPSEVYPNAPECETAAIGMVKGEVPNASGFAAITYDYCNEACETIALAIRVDFTNHDGTRGKKFRPFHSVDGGFAAGGIDDRPLYDLPGVVDSSLCIVTEGEKCCDAINVLLDESKVAGVWATTSMGGAQAPAKTNWSPLSGKKVYIWPDNDESGQIYCNKVVDILRGLPVPPICIRVIPVDDLPPKGDAYDWIDDNCGLGDSADLIDCLSALNDRLSKAIEVPIEKDAQAVTTTKRKDRNTNSAPVRVEPVGDVAGTDGAIDILRDQGRTEISNARRFVAAFGGDVRWCEAWSRWFVWNGKIWEFDQSLRVESMAKSVVDSLYSELPRVAREDDSQLMKKTLAFIKESAKRSGISAMLSLAKSEPGIAVDWRQFNKDPMLLTVPNGTIDLQTGDLRSHSREDWITQLCPTPYDPAADCPTFIRFIRQIFCGNDELIDFVRRAIGYGLTGDTSEQVLFICHGTGSNGKSVLLGVLHDLLGGELALQASRDLLMDSHNDHPTAVADLWQKRFVTCIEQNAGQRFDEGQLKGLTGSDPIWARRMRENGWQFMPTHKLWLATNHLPVVRGTDRGIWRRMRVIPFLFSTPPGGADERLPEKLRQELPGILQWALVGLQDWRENRLGVASAVETATKDYRSSMDIVGQFLDECCVLGDDLEVRNCDIYQHYEAWARSNGDRPMSGKAFGSELARKFATRKSGSKIYLGLAISSS